MKQKNRTVINIGTTSLIMIFAVLALVTFALLSLSSASAQWRMAEKMAERMTLYYAGETQAAEAVQQMLDQDAETMLEEAGEWQIPIGEKQQLEVKLRVFEMDGKQNWELEQWKLADGGVREIQQTLELYGVPDKAEKQ